MFISCYIKSPVRNLKKKEREREREAAGRSKYWAVEESEFLTFLDLVTLLSDIPYFEGLSMCNQGLTM